MTFDEQAFQKKLASALGAAQAEGFDIDAFKTKLVDALGEVASEWEASFTRNPVTLATTSMHMRPKDGSSPGVVVTAIDDPATGLMVAADIVVLRG